MEHRKIDLHENETLMNVSKDIETLVLDSMD